MIDLGATDRRFWDNVKIGRGDECWLWQGRKDRRGYGHFWTNRQASILAHRVAWELVYGERPAQHVLHRCDVPGCVRTSHLFLGTDKDNSADRDTKWRNGYSAKTHCKQGHEWTHENTMPRSDCPKQRRCRECSRISCARWKARRRAQ